MRIGDGSSDVCSADLSAPSQIEKYDLRRQVQGESMYASLRIERQDTVGRAAFGKVNVVSFGAPVLLLCHFPKMMKEAQWVDVGIWLQTIMLGSEEHTSELQSLMSNSYAVFCLKKKKTIYSEISQLIAHT